MAVAKLAHPLREAIDAHVIGDLIEIGIRGLLKRFGDVQVAVAPFFPVTIAFFRAGQLPPARVKQAGIAGDHPGAQRRDGDVRFDRRCRRIDPLRRTVDQRRVRIVEQAGVIFTGDAVDEQVRVVARRRNQRQNGAGTRVGDHHCGAATSQQRFDILLQLEVKGEVDVASGLRRHLFELTNHAAAVVHFNLLVAGLTVQDVLVITLNTQLTDVVGRGVVGQFALFIEAVDVFIVNFRNVADDVRQRRVIGIVTALVAFDFHAGKAVLVDGKAGHLHFAEVDLYRNRGKAMGAGALLFEAGDIIVG